MSTSSAHLIVRARYHDDTLEEILHVAPSFQHYESIAAIAREKVLVIGALREALVSGRFAELEWPETLRPSETTGRRDVTLHVELANTGGTILEKVSGIRDALAHGQMRFRVTASLSEVTREKPSIRPISWQVWLGVLGKPNPILFSVPATTRLEAIREATSFIHDNRPDLADKPVLCFNLAPCLSSHFHVHNRAHSECEGFSNRTTYNLYRALIDDSALMNELCQAMHPENGIALSQLSQLAARLSEPLRAKLDDDGPINWRQLAGTLEKEMLGHAVHMEPAVRDDRDALLPVISTMFEWQPRQKAIFSALTPQNALYRCLGITDAAREWPDAQARAASFMLKDMPGRKSKQNFYAPTQALLDQMKNAGTSELNPELIEQVMENYLSKSASSLTTEPAVSEP